jgi:hypothetical protein
MRIKPRSEILFLPLSKSIVALTCQSEQERKLEEEEEEVLYLSALITVAVTLNLQSLVLLMFVW